MSAETARPASLSTQSKRRLLWLFSVLIALSGRRYARLDMETMEPHMLRDLGFLDGRDPRYEPADRR